MIYQVLINFNDKKNKPVEVADSEERFNKTTVRQLKEKFRQKIPGAPDPDDARVIFGKDLLEDYRTLEFYKIKHLSVLFIVMKMPGGGPLHPVIETQRKGSETVGLFGLFKIGSSIPQTGTEIGKIQERDSLPQYTGGTRPPSTIDRGREEKKGAGKVDPLPAGASSVQPDADLQFLQSLLPALKRMDIRQRECTKLRIQQLVFDAEFNDTNSSGKGIRRTDSMEKMPPFM